MKKHTWPALPVNALLACLLLIACAPLPQPDPHREELAILQKQLLELQKLQLETKTKLSETTRTIDLVSVKVEKLENQQNRPAAQLKHEPPVAKKKPVDNRAGKKKKKIRRLE